MKADGKDIKIVHKSCASYLQSHRRHLHTSSHAGEARCTTQDCKPDHDGWFGIKGDHADTPIIDWIHGHWFKRADFGSSLVCWRSRRKNFEPLDTSVFVHSASRVSKSRIGHPALTLNDPPASLAISLTLPHAAHRNFGQKYTRRSVLCWLAQTGL